VIKQSRKYVVLPLLIPGSGKSSLANALKKSSTCSWKVIESDQIRR
jgi:adenylylsulfate kinase-like enzyme